MKGFIISIMAFVALALTGCFNHRYINGDLDGQWQIMEIELADGRGKACSDILLH